eukprot:gi/632958712/ref/XP_007895196.1/ PREDICTED: TRAF-interacting protein with FHA domain-containing protein A [Callorhinchus milii]
MSCDRTAFETAETEETITCLNIHIYHPQPTVFQSLTLDKKLKFRTDEVLKFGRDSNICNFPLIDKRASRIQFSIQAVRFLESTELCFEIKNLSLKTKISVDFAILNHLNKVELLRRGLLRFGEYQLCLEKEDGESREQFEILFKLSLVPLYPERVVESLNISVPESGILNNGGITSSLSSLAIPVEMDENDLNKPT